MEGARRAPRLILDARIEGLAHSWTEARVLDLSPSGALIETATPRPEPGSELAIELSLEGETLTVHAHVVRTTPGPRPGSYRAGVEFSSLPASTRAQIQKYLERIPPRERRTQPRFFVDEPVQLKKEVELRVLNLSLFGGLFSTGSPLAFDSEHDFVFALPSGEVRARGRVRHCEAWAETKGAAIFRLGVEFTQVDAADREHIVRYLEERVQGS